MLIGDIGDVRTGKTLLMTKFLTQLANIPENRDHGFACFSNFHINDKRVKYITVDDFINLELPQLNSGLCGLQELWGWLYSRLSGSEVNRAINPIIFQSGKRGFDIMWDGQLASAIDKSVRLLTDKFWVARPPLKDRSIPYHPKLVAFRYAYVTNKVILKWNFPLKAVKDGRVIPIAERYFSLYNTTERADLQYVSDGQNPQRNPNYEPDSVPKELPPNVEQPFNSSEPKTPLIPSDGKYNEELERMIGSGKVKDMKMLDDE